MTYSQQFTIADCRYKVSTNSSPIADGLQYLLSSFETPELSSAPLITYVIKQTSDKTIHLCFDGQIEKTYETVDSCLTQFEWQLIRSAFDQMHYIGIHSGGIVCNNKTLLFPGRSGKGKTSLTLGCLLRGCGFLSDEIALVEPKTLRVHPFPRVLCIKNNPQIFQPLDSGNALQNPDIATQINNSLCVSPKFFNCIPEHQSRAINAIIFPNFHPNVETVLTPIPPLASLKKLLQLTHKRTQTPHVLDTLGQIVERAPSYELTMSNLVDAIKKVEDFAN